MPLRTRAVGETPARRVPPPVGPVAVGAHGSIAPSGFTTAGPTGQATLTLRQTLTFDQRKQSVRDAMAYAAGMGVTTHLDQGPFQATGTPVDGSAHEDNLTMHLPLLAVYSEGEQRDVAVTNEGSIRLRINFLRCDTDAAVPIATQRIQNAFPFFGTDLVRTGAAGEFLADPFRFYADGNDVWMAAALTAAQAGWRAEVHSITGAGFQTEIASFEAVDAQVPITGLRWVVAHVPHITEDYVNRLKAVGGGVNLTTYRYFNTASPGGLPCRMLLDNGIPVGLSSDRMQIAPMNPWIHAYYATTGLNALGNQINPGSAAAALAADRARRHRRALRRYPLLGMTSACGGWAGAARQHQRAPPCMWLTQLSGILCSTISISAGCLLSRTGARRLGFLA